MKINLDKILEDFLKIIAKNALIQKTGVFFVGGFVRDLILNIDCKDFSKDIDLIIEGNALDFINLICAEYKKNKKPCPIIIKSIHKDFATVKVEYIAKNAKPIIADIASTRSEKYPFSGCLPKLINVGIKIKDDVKRRDFSVNSLYLEIKFNPENSTLDFEIIDFTKGIDDIKSKTLRVLHKNSYTDDPTRILRGLDFKYRFGFDFSSDDKKLINNYLKKIEYNSSKDRIKSVFLKILSSKNNNKIFQEIIDKKLYKILFDFEIGFVDINKINEIIELFKGFYQNSISNNIVSKFYFSILENKEIEKLTFENELKVKRFFEKFEIDKLMYYFYRTNDENIPVYLKIKDLKLFIKGEDLINLNFPKGKIIGEILDKIMLEKLKNPEFFSSKEDEIKKIKQYIKQKIFIPENLKI